MKSFKQYISERNLEGTSKTRKYHVKNTPGQKDPVKDEDEIEEKSNPRDMACNKPKAERKGGKSHVVKACDGGKEKVIRFGQAGVKGSPDGSKRNKAFKARHAKNIAKGKMSAAYWANKVKW